MTPTMNPPGVPAINTILQSLLAAVEKRPTLDDVKAIIPDTTARDKAMIRRMEKFADAIESAERQFAADADSRVRALVAELSPRRLEVVVNGLTVYSAVSRRRPQFEEIVQTVAADLNVLLVGPAGCGKTTMAHQVADALGLRFSFIACTAGMSESRLIGKFAPTGENGRFEYQPTPFIDFYKNGGVFLLDEVDAADPNVLLVINAALANGHMETPNPAEPVITRHPNFRLIAAANTWGTGADRQYVGRNQLDAATLDRFVGGIFEIDYDEELERELGAGHGAFVDWCQELRRRVRDHKIRRVVSTRLVINGVRRMAAGATMEQVTRSFLLPWTAAERSACGV